jgi:hypothetical protein
MKNDVLYRNGVGEQIEEAFVNHRSLEGDERIT